MTGQVCTLDYIPTNPGSLATGIGVSVEVPLSVRASPANYPGPSCSLLTYLRNHPVYGNQ